MSRARVLYGRSAFVAIGVVATLALAAACGDRETLTDVAAPGAGTPRVTTPSLAVGGNKPTAPSSYEVMKTTATVETDFQGAFEAHCTAGKRVLGGGFFIDGGVPINGPDVYVYESSPRVTLAGAEGWRLNAMNRTGGQRTFTVYAICATM